MIKIDSAVRNLVNRVFRVMQAARLAQHLADTLAGRLRHGEHDEDHGKNGRHKRAPLVDERLEIDGFLRLQLYLIPLITSSEHTSDSQVLQLQG